MRFSEQVFPVRRSVFFVLFRNTGCLTRVCADSSGETEAVLAFGNPRPLPVKGGTKGVFSSLERFGWTEISGDDWCAEWSGVWGNSALDWTDNPVRLFSGTGSTGRLA